MAPLRASTTKSEQLPDDPTGFVPSTLWKLPSITTWDDSRNQNHPTDSAEEAHLISAGDYHESVNQRLIKIGARLKDSAFPRSIKQSSRQARSALRDSAIEYLSRTEQTLLLKHLDRYIPISEKRLSTVVRCVVGMLGGLGNYGIHLGPTSFSASFTKTGRLVFWDFFPARVAEAEALYGGG